MYLISKQSQCLCTYDDYKKNYSSLLYRSSVISYHFSFSFILTVNDTAGREHNFTFHKFYITYGMRNDCCWIIKINKRFHLQSLLIIFNSMLFVILNGTIYLWIEHFLFFFIFCILTYNISSAVRNDYNNCNLFRKDAFDLMWIYVKEWRIKSESDIYLYADYLRNSILLQWKLFFLIISLSFNRYFFFNNWHFYDVMNFWISIVILPILFHF